MQIKYSRIISHVRTDTDEIYAAYLLKKRGEKFFPGVSSSQVVFSEKDPVGGDAVYDEMGSIPVGCGEGARFNEHIPTGRIPNECAAALVAKHLQVAGEQGVKEILEEVLFGDTNSGVGTFELGQIVKLMHRVMPNADTLLVRYFFSIFDVLTKKLQLGLQNKPNGKLLTDYVEEYCGKVLQDSKIKAFIMMRAKQDQEVSTGRRLLGLSVIIDAYRTLGEEGWENEIKELVRFCVEAMYRDQVEMAKMQVYIKEECEEFYAPRGPGSKPLRCIYIKSSDPRALTASNYLGYQVTFLRQDSGNFQIFLDKKTNLSLKYVVRMLRWLESDPDVRLLAKVNAYYQAGEHHLCPHLHYFAEAEMFFNGSRTHPGVTPSLLASQVIIDAILHGFCPEMSRRFWAFWNEAPAATSAVTPRIDLERELVTRKK